MSITNTKYIKSETFPCGYFEDGRIAYYNFYGYDQPTIFPFQKSVLEPIRKNRFSLMQRGLIGNIFSSTANSCETCNECVPLRISTLNFKETTRQKRILNIFYDSGGQTIWLSSNEASDAIPHLFQLYKKYLSARFPTSHMNDHDIEDLAITIISKTNVMILLNGDDKLIGFTQVDHCAPEASLDYVVYDPDYKDLFLGSVSFLETVKWAQENFIPYVYIGATNESPALKYKRYYSGLETFDGEDWIPYDPKTHTQGPDYDTIVQGFPAQRRKEIANHPNV